LLFIWFAYIYSPCFEKMALYFRHLFLAFALLGVTNWGRAQVLVTQSLNLLPGEVIYDIAEDDFHDCYVVVGNFTEINNVTVKNIAFINKSDFSVNTLAQLNTVSGMDGEIRCVEVHTEYVAPTMRTRIYIGGNFTSITTTGGTYARIGFAELQTNYNVMTMVTQSMNVTSWNIQMEAAGFELGVNEILLQTDTLILAGGFYFSNGALPYFSLSNIISFHATTHAWIPIFNTTDMENQGYNFYLGHVLSIERFGSNYYVSGSESYSSGSGTGFIVRCDENGIYDPTFSAPLCGTANAVWKALPVVSGNDTLLVSCGKYAASTDLYAHDITGPLLDGPFCGSTTIFSNTGEGIETYKDFLFTRTPGSLRVLDFSGADPAPVLTTINTNATSYTTSGGGLASGMGAPGGLGYRRMHIVDNYLFVSGNSLTTIAGQPKVGLAAFCLEPGDAKFFTTSDSTVCPDQVVTYAIPEVDFADGYKWVYTGTGADLVPGVGVEDSVELNGAHFISVTYLSNFTPGQLKVTPYAYCNGTTKIYSNTITTNIISNPIPHINAGNDTLLTCAVDSILLHGYSDSAVISYEWLKPFPPNVMSQDTLIDQPGNYVFKVTNALGCPNFDTVVVTQNVTPPVPVAPTGNYELTCAEPVKDFLGTSTTPNATSEWRDPLTGNYLPNPAAIGSPGSYTFIVTDTLNGCKDSLAILVELNVDQPNITVVGYPGYNPAQALDTLTCLQPVLNLTCSSDTSNTTATWTDQDTLTAAGANITITNPGNYYILVTNNSNGCTNFTGINIASYQTVPGVFAPDDNLLNCSVDSLLLDGVSLLSGAGTSWSGGTLVNAPDPVVIYDPGTYYFTATNPENGCVAIDSTVVSQDNSIAVWAGDDVLACDQDFVNLTATYTGTITGISYAWNNGGNTANALYTAEAASQAIVEIFGDNVCYGTDTVIMNIPPTPVITFEGFKPCDDGPSGQIVASPVSGTAPFQYSIDSGNSYQTSPIFTGLTVGTYPIWVKDSLGCDYPFSGTIDASSALPEPSYLFSTYNFSGDTVVIVDVSNPPADSTDWIFSPGVVLLDDNSTSPVIVLPDTGVFQITMNAWYGNCLIELTRDIYSLSYDSTAANYYNSNGIKSIELYPNPTTGNFTVDVEFFKSQRAVLLVQDMIGNTYIYNEFDETVVISESVSLDLNALDGSYVLKVISEFDSASITFILAR
jgi:hypothetical protein